MAGRAVSAKALLADLNLHSEEVARRLRCVDFRSEDAKFVDEIRELLLPRVNEYCDCFFDYLASLPESRAMFASPSVLQEARRQKTEHLKGMLSGDYGLEYAEQRAALALLYYEAGLDTAAFLGAFDHLMARIGSDLATEGKAADASFFSLMKIVFFDIGIIVDVLMVLRQRVISQQAAEIRELSTPVLQIRERLLLLPIIGVIDTHRARMITENLLHAVRQRRARVVVMDITGVVTIDSRVSHHLLQTVSAARLMGATVVMTGVSAEVAQSLVALGIDLEKFNTVGDLQEGVLAAERILGYRLVQEQD
jgi:rsbT co-antagonist protein RsbR